MALLLTLLFSCTPYRKMQRIRSGQVEIGLSVPEDRIPDEREDEPVIDSIRGTLSDGPIIMNAIRDSETGEMVATDVIRASRVTARFRNVAHRMQSGGAKHSPAWPSYGPLCSSCQ